MQTINESCSHADIEDKDIEDKDVEDKDVEVSKGDDVEEKI